ncbi:hypothetical protein YC2023_044325 [Brassica napus]
MFAKDIPAAKGEARPLKSLISAGSSAKAATSLSNRSKIFVIDADGTRTKDIARASRKLGITASNSCPYHS